MGDALNAVWLETGTETMGIGMFVGDAVAEAACRIKLPIEQERSREERSRLCV